MSNKRTVGLPQVKSSDPSPTNSMTRSKKLPPPPLCLPATDTTTDEEKLSTSNQQYEQKTTTNTCCLSSSSKECPHEHIPYVLPIGQRSQILETLITSSSKLLVPSSSSETKQRKSHASINLNQTNLFEQYQASRRSTVTDTEWLDFIRFIVHKPLENELKMLLDKYKMTYFDRVNAPNTTDATIRSILCDMVSQILATYSTSSSSSIETNNSSTNVSSSIVATSTNNNSSLKRKRNDTNANISESLTVPINNQTKFVISHIIPGKYDKTTNTNKIIYQQRQKQFQKKYSHLFKYIPNKDEREYLLRDGHLKSSSNNQTNNICLMLYDEVLAYMDEYDLELSGISIDNSFTLSEPILTHIHTII